MKKRKHIIIFSTPDDELTIDIETWYKEQLKDKLKFVDRAYRYDNRKSEIKTCVMEFEEL